MTQQTKTQTTQEMLEEHMESIAEGFQTAEDAQNLFDDDGILDIEYKVDRFGRLKAADVLITSGGPNIWIEVDIDGRSTLEGSWGRGRYDANLPVSFGRALFDLIEQIGPVMNY